METRINRADFLAELAPMQGIVERKSTIPVLSHILLRAEGNELELAATDLEVSLTSSVPAEVEGEGAVAVQARKFVEIIRAVSEDEVQLTLDDDNQLGIEAGKSRFKIRGLSPEDFPTLPEVPEERAIELPFEQLKNMIAKVIFAVSTEESRFQLNGALLKLKDGYIELVATDGHRLALVENALEGASEAPGVLVPRKALHELQRFEGNGVVKYRRSESHLSFHLGRRELICRVLDGTFPDYERVIAKDNDREAVLDRVAMADAVQRVALLTGDRARAVRLGFGQDRLVISAVNPDLGEAVEEVDCSFASEDVTLGLNPDYLTHFLGAVDSGEVKLALKDENSQAVGTPVDGSDGRYLCVIMPMRI